MSNTDVVMAFINAVNDMNWETVGEFADIMEGLGLERSEVVSGSTVQGVITRTAEQTIISGLAELSRNGLRYPIPNIGLEVSPVSALAQSYGPG